jgi:protein-S-isoprenylcysteine O-methyltransferase Ste14
MDRQSPPPVAATLRPSIFSFGGFFPILAVLLFVPAGDLRWAGGWLFFLVVFILCVLSAIFLWHVNPEIFVARSKFLRQFLQQGTKRWDKVVALFLGPPLLAIFPVAALDWRFHWLYVPTWLVVLGYVLLVLGMALSTWPMAVNKFAEPGVRIQAERGHKVVDTEPYAIVRHPIYLAAFFLFVGSALALGSIWALVPATLGYLVLIVRTALEDRTLQEELDGYREYAGRVRYRLIPGVW